MHVRVANALSDSTVRNAATSPLLLLPPEIRSRIWDAVFADLVVRVNFGGKYINGRLDHRRTTCHTSRRCEYHMHRRFRAERITFRSTNGEMQATGCQMNKPREMPVHLLQVCRQIYHEAALKPFTEPTFAFTMSNTEHGMNSFLTALIPEQARAIGHLYIISHRMLVFRLSKLAANLFRGVKHVEVQVGESGHLEVFKHQGGVHWLKNAGLQSVRFTVRYYQEATARPDVAEEHKAATMAWITREEADILTKQDEMMADV
jgi:hypothetical protein